MFEGDNSYYFPNFRLQALSLKLILLERLDFYENGRTLYFLSYDEVTKVLSQSVPTLKDASRGEEA